MVALRQPTDEGRAVLTIREKLRAIAEAKRERVCPPNHCPTCFRSYGRALFMGCCICTGHVSTARPDLSKFFPPKTQHKQQTDEN